MGNQSTLEELIIRVDINTNSVSWMPLLPLFKCLKSVEILPDFIHRECAIVLTGCSALEKLTLGGMRATFADDMMRLLSVLPNLKCLRLGAGSLPDSELVALTTFPSLEQLYLECDVPNYIEKMLLRHIPKVIIE
ncbi:hypothetical protein O0I10_011739 [Lichtheimia ornata]|uniref:Uncharacterized protein n=1 Tax=Lichtheimia ornata TaxID=688661 RepID=A0AAD7US64_9FUNG|nr:uncharacterized protein O0I10_011739 [Lichtheimia ornata]KAJ8652593.1 hypothetical protein O0I10_011739 [Lichtheimia ornata]